MNNDELRILIDSLTLKVENTVGPFLATIPLPNAQGSAGSGSSGSGSSGSGSSDDTSLPTFESTYDASIKSFAHYIEYIAQLLKQYRLEETAYKISTNLFNKLKTENDELVHKLDIYKRVLNTNERKVVYVSNSTNNLFLYRKILVFVYYFIIIGYIVFGNFIPDKLYNKTMSWVIILLMASIPLILNILIRWVIVTYDVLKYWFSDIPHKDVYTNVDETLDEIVNK